MVFGNKGQKEDTKLVIEKVNIECVTKITFWWVILDRKFS